MTDPGPITRDELKVFLAVKERGLAPVLRGLGIRLIGKATQWSVVWRAIGLAEDQDPADFDALKAPLLPASAVAELCGGVSTSIIYRWHKGQTARGVPALPPAIDLSCGRENARALRWRRSEIKAWHAIEPIPSYARPVPVFGTLLPSP